MLASWAAEAIGGSGAAARAVMVTVVAAEVIRSGSRGGGTGGDGWRPTAAEAEAIGGSAMARWRQGR